MTDRATASQSQLAALQRRKAVELVACRMQMALDDDLSEVTNPSV
jgi:hypothetical protein